MIIAGDRSQLKSIGSYGYNRRRGQGSSSKPYQSYGSGDLQVVRAQVPLGMNLIRWIYSYSFVVHAFVVFPVAGFDAENEEEETLKRTEESTPTPSPLMANPRRVEGYQTPVS
jgi:hypothetical protein